jgi:uncharacterized protein (UPF0216 family)
MTLYESKSAVERAFDVLIGHEIRKLNTHLPKQRRPLSELLKNPGDTTIEAVDGSAILLKESEVKDLANVVPLEYHDKVKLPLVILRRIELGKSIFTVTGERVEEFTVQKILHNTNDGFHEMCKHRNQTYLYRPEVTELIRRFHSLIVIGFGIPEELRDYAPRRD